jgi:cobalt-zinc-cadmium efflux system outer membrane protein
VAHPAFLAAVFGVLALAAPASSLRAQDLVLGDLYRDVTHASPRAEAARAMARAARARVAQAKLPPDPALQFGVMNYALPGLRPMDALGMTQLQLMQMLPVAGKLQLAGRVADAQASAAAMRATNVDWELRSEAARSFYELYATERALVIARQALRTLQNISATTQSMYRVGEGRQADVLRAQVEIARMVEDTIRMRAERTAMTARLNGLLYRAPETELASPVLPRFPSSVPPLDSLERLAPDSRPLVRAAADEVEAARSSERLARREIWPDLQLGAQYGRQTSQGGERMGSVMIGATLPIFARSRQLRMREEAAAMRQAASGDLAAMIVETRTMLTVAYADLGQARRLTALYRTTVLPQANAVVGSALAAYRVGSVDFMTLLDNQMAAYRYGRELATLEADEGKAWAELERLTGRELLDPSSTIHMTAAGGVR